MVDYALKDYETIFNFLTSQATQLSNGQWTDFTDGDFGTIIIHLLSYWGDLLSNQLDLTASELFVGTAEERTSLMEIVKLIGYEPNSYQSSKATLHITHNTDPNMQFETETLPAYSKFISNSGLSYYNLSPVRLTGGTTVVQAYEGTLTTKSFNYSNITTDGRIQINDSNLATNTVSLTIVSGILTGSVERVADVRFTTGELCFSVHTDLDGYPYIQLPAWWNNLLSDPVTMSVTYLKTKGIDGRVGANTIYRIANNSNISTKYTITNPTASTGGSNPETVAEIKAKATAFARTMYTAVTLKDFEDMALFTDTIVQVKALDYNHPAEEFPPTIAPYKQPTPPNGIPNDAYKVLIMAVPGDFNTSTIFTGDSIEYVDDTGKTRLKPDYGSLTDDMMLLHNEYMDRKSATLYLEYRDPIYIRPWLIMNIYLKNKEDVRSGDVAVSVRDYLRLRFARNRVAIGQSIYGSQIGREILSSYNYINYIEVRDPEYNIKAKPYEFIDMFNGYYMSWVDDELMLVPDGLNLVKMSQGDQVMLNIGTKEEPKTVNISWVTEDKYSQNPEYIANSYKYEWSKTEGKYPRPNLDRLGLFWEQDGKVMTLIIPDSMYLLDGTQTLEMKDGDIYHFFSASATISEIGSFTKGNTPSLPGFVTYEIIEAGTDNERCKISLQADYAAEKVKAYTVRANQRIYIVYPDGSRFEFTNNTSTELNTDMLLADIHVTEDGIEYTFYVPESWKVKVIEVGE